MSRCRDCAMRFRVGIAHLAACGHGAPLAPNPPCVRPKLRTTLTPDASRSHQLQRIAGPPLPPLHQSVPRLRAWVYRLLRAAEPRAPRILARPRFRDPARVQTGRGVTAARGARQAGLPLRPDRAGDEHRPLLFATRPAVLTRVLGVVYRTISTCLIRRTGLRVRSGPRTGAVTLIQRVGCRSTSTCTCSSSTAPTPSKTNSPASTVSPPRPSLNSSACSTPSPPASLAPWKSRDCCSATTKPSVQSRANL